MNPTIAARVNCVRPDLPQSQGLSFVPILGPSHEHPPYGLLQGDALSKVRVTEVSQSGHVPELKVVNELEMAVFLMDGQELIGAKQNRILNTDVLVPAASTINIPVSCVEAGRWGYNSPTFAAGKAASHRIRAAKQSRVHRALMADGKHDADQGAVWDEVSMSLAGAAAVSASSSLHDAYDQRKADLDRHRSALRLPEDAVGLAVFRGEKFAGLDLFDRHSTLVYFWESLLDSYFIDYLGEAVDPKAPATTPEAQAVQELLSQAAEGHWESFASPGMGRDWRLEVGAIGDQGGPAQGGDQGLSGSALVAEDAVIHLQLFPRQAEQQREHRPRLHRRWVR